MFALKTISSTSKSEVLSGLKGLLHPFTPDETPKYKGSLTPWLLFCIHWNVTAQVVHAILFATPLSVPLGVAKVVSFIISVSCEIFPGRPRDGFTLSPIHHLLISA